MIQLTKPIEVHNMPLKTASSEGFSKGLIANYDQINITVGPKDLIHLVTQPPEFFYAEGDATNIFNQNIDVRNINENKMEVINELVNRITLHDSKSLTYQDNVYISNVLRKLGIKNEAQFLSQVYKNLEETNNLSKTVKVLNEVTEVIKNSYNEDTRTVNESDLSYITSTLKKIGITDTENFIERVTNKISSENKNTEVTNRITNQQLVFNQQAAASEDEGDETAEQRIISELIGSTEFRPRLYQQILKRVGIDNNIELLKRTSLNMTQQNFLTSNEMNLSTFNRVLNENNLTEAKESGAAPITLEYRQENVYESQPDLTEVNEENINSQLTSAVLYQIIENVNNSRINRGLSWENKWVNVNNALYQSAEESITRFEENITAPINKQFYTQQTEQQIIDELNQIEINNQTRERLYEKAQKQQAEMMKQQAAGPKRTSSAAQKDALLALTNPEDFKAQVEREKEEALTQINNQTINYTENLPAGIKARMELLQTIMKTEQGEELTEADAKVISQVFSEIRSERNVSNVNNLVNEKNIEEVKSQVTEVKEQVKKLPDEVESILKAVGVAGNQILTGDAAIDALQNQIEELNLVHNIANISDINEETAETNITEENILKNIENRSQINRTLNQQEVEAQNLVLNRKTGRDVTEVVNEAQTTNEQLVTNEAQVRNATEKIIRNLVANDSTIRLENSEDISKAVELIHSQTGIDETEIRENLETLNQQRVSRETQVRNVTEEIVKNLVDNDSTVRLENKEHVSHVVELIHNQTGKDQTEIINELQTLNEQKITNETQVRNVVENLLRSNVTNETTVRRENTEDVSRALELIHNQTGRVDTTEVENEEIVNRNQQEIRKLVTEEQTAGEIKKQIKKKAPKIINEQLEEISKINLVHKTTNELDTEEIVERLQQEKQLVEDQKVVKEEHHTVINQEVNEEHTRKIIKKEIENYNITEQINSTVHRQLSDFEGEIFNKLETKLEAEQERRGIF